jgi:hypothetical protein
MRFRFRDSEPRVRHNSLALPHQRGDWVNRRVNRKWEKKRSKSQRRLRRLPRFRVRGEWRVNSSGVNELLMIWLVKLWARSGHRVNRAGQRLAAPNCQRICRSSREPLTAPPPIGGLSISLFFAIFPGSFDLTCHWSERWCELCKPL